MLLLVCGIIAVNRVHPGTHTTRALSCLYASTLQNVRRADDPWILSEGSKCALRRIEYLNASACAAPPFASDLLDIENAIHLGRFAPGSGTYRLNFASAISIKYRPSSLQIHR
jgi:hypothetical protein